MSGVYPLHRLWISDVSDYGTDAGVGRKEDVQGCLGAPDSQLPLLHSFAFYLPLRTLTSIARRLQPLS